VESLGLLVGHQWAAYLIYTPTNHALRDIAVSAPQSAIACGNSARTATTRPTTSTCPSPRLIEFDDPQSQSRRRWISPRNGCEGERQFRRFN